MTKRVLVVIMAETRASGLTFNLFQKHVLNALSADLALCVGDNKREMTDNPFYGAAKYLWVAREYDDWALAFDQLAERAVWREFPRDGIASRRGILPLIVPGSERIAL